MKTFVIVINDEDTSPDGQPIDVYVQSLTSQKAVDIVLLHQRFHSKIACNYSEIRAFVSDLGLERQEYRMPLAGDVILIF